MKQNGIKIEKIWETICKEAQVSLKKSNYMKKYFEENILSHDGFADALSYKMGAKLCSSDFERSGFISIIREQMNKFSNICEYAVDDLIAFYERDPACHWFYQPFLFYKGFIALQTYRVANALYTNGDIDFALFCE